MATAQLAPILHYLRKVTNPTAGGDVPDADLLSRFCHHRDESAFATLVRRHGPMVLAVCRRVVQDGHAAEDAFQATFLVLARKAGSLARPELLAHWLHGVAYRTAIKAKTEAVKRRIHERQAVRALAIDAGAEHEWHDLRAVLDEEVNRLPQRYRVPVVLCYLQGQTNAEAARRLGCSRGTVATLLARARDKLRRRLTQRGVSLSIGFGLAALTPIARGGTVPLALEQGTVKAAMLLAAGQMQAAGALAAKAIALAKGVSQGMLMEKLKIPTAILVMVAVIGTGAGLSAYRAGTQEPEVAESKNEAKPRSRNKTAKPIQPLVAVAEAPKDEKATYRTPNFIVTAPTMEIARQVGQAAEHNRNELAWMWLGKRLADWGRPCPVRVTLTEKLPGGATEFAFDNGRVLSTNMHLEGSLDRILADLLPHEITHTILAHWRGKPLPRWADEGAAMISESAVSRARQEEEVERLLRSGQPLPLAELLPKLNYPKDVKAFFAQSLSLTDFLVAKGGRQRFLAFVAQGEDEGWDYAAQSVYGYRTVKVLEEAWLAHARKQQAEKQTKEPLPVRKESHVAPKNRKPENLMIQRDDLFPTGSAPRPVVAIIQENRLFLLRRVTYYEPVTREVISKEGTTRRSTSYQQKHHYHTTEYECDINTFAVQDAKGRKIDAKELGKRLKEATLVLVPADGLPVDPLHLRLYKEDTLVFVLPPPASRQPPAPAPGFEPPPTAQGKPPLVAPPPPPTVQGTPPLDASLFHAVPMPPRVAPPEPVDDSESVVPPK